MHVISRSTVANALRCAADIYKKDADGARASGNARIGEQFERQAMEAESIAALLDGGLPVKFRDN